MRDVIVGVPLGLLLVFLFLQEWAHQLVVHLAAGWYFFVRDNVLALQVNGTLLAEAAVCLLVLGIGTHWFCSWVYASAASGTARRWPGRWTAAALALLFLLFAGGIAIIGLTHQIAWLANSTEPFTEVAPRYRMMEAMFLAGNVQTEVEEHFERTSRFPDPNDSLSIRRSLQDTVSRMSVDEHGVIALTIAPRLGGGGTISLIPRADGARLVWECKSTLVERFTPSACTRQMPPAM